MEVNDMLKMILDRHSQEKAHLLKVVNKHRQATFSINQLAIELGVNYRKLNQLAAEIDQDFAALGWSPFIVKKGLVLWESNEMAHNQYLRYLIRHSLGWRLLFCILMTPEKSLADFCQEHFTSRSTVIRRTKLLVDYFKQTEIRLLPAQMSLSGNNEDLVQILLFTFAWYGSFGKELIDATDTRSAQQLVDQLYDGLGPTLNRKVAIASLVIAGTRLTAGYPLPAIKHPPRLFPEKYQLIQSYFRRLAPDDLSGADRCAESLYYKLLVVPFVSSRDWRYPATVTTFQEDLTAGSPAAVLSVELLDFLAPTFFSLPVDETVKQVMLCNLQAVFRSLNDPQLLAPIQLHTLLPDSVHELGTLQELKTACQRFITWQLEQTRNPQLASLYGTTALPKVLAETVYPLICRQRYAPTVMIGIQQMPNFHMLTDLFHFLDQLNFVQYEIWQEEKEYDYYIGITPGIFPPDKPCTLITFQRQDHRGELFQQLLETLQGKALY